ncbi:MAG: membrane integrity-associated transporter subunit PqiC [Succinivibrio sp.]
MKKIALTTVLVLMLTGCVTSGTNINYDRYSLVEGVSSKSFDSNYNVNVNLYEALDDGGIVIKTSDVTLRSANSHRWTSSLKDQIKVLFADSLLRKNIQDNLQYEIYVAKFYGSVDGMVYIDLNVKVNRENKQIYSRDFVYENQQRNDGYDALTSELKKGVIEIFDTFASDINDHL